MAKATKSDLDKKKKELDKHLAKMANRIIGQQKIPSLITMVLGAIRSSWAISPVKLAYFEMGRTPDEDNTPRKWMWQCEYCDNWLSEGEVEIDHIIGNSSFTKPSDFESYFDSILDVQFKDLQRICKFKCHRVKSHLEKQGFSTMSEAACDKINIFLIKFTKTEAYTAWLSANGVTPESSAPKRRKQGMQFWTSLSAPEDELLNFFESCDYLMRLENKKKKAKRFKLTAKDTVKLQHFIDFWSKYNIKEPVCEFTLV
jgi:hypothetical protein